MFKKFISMTTAVLMMASGISIIGAAPASASTDATLSATSTIKGVTVVSLGTPGTSPGTIGARGSIHISTTAATDTSNAGSYITNFVTTNSSASKQYVWKHAAGGNLSNSSTYNGSAAISDGDIFSIYVKSADNSTSKLYAIDVQVSANGSSPSSSSSSSSASTNSGAAILGSATVAQQRQRTAAIGASKNALSQAFGNGKANTLAAFASAGINISSEAALERINAKILELPIEKRSKIEEIERIVDLENFIDRVAVTETRSSVRSNELVSRGLLPAESTYKHSVVQGLASYPNGSLNSLEKITAAVKEQIAKAGARKAQTAEIKAKIAARNK